MKDLVIRSCIFFGIVFLIGFVATMWLGCYLSNQWFMAIVWQGIVLLAGAGTLFIIAGILIRDRRYWNH